MDISSFDPISIPLYNVLWKLNIIYNKGGCLFVGMKKKSSLVALFMTIVLMVGFILAPTISAQAASNPLLSIGSRGDAVAQLQQELKNRGYFTYHQITGYYGSITRDAVIKFQRDYGLGVDGIAGPKTHAILYQGAPSRGDGRGVLYFGMQGQRVQDIQNQLKAKGYFRGTATGYYGHVTQNAVIAFQKDFSLKIDGIVGPETERVLFSNTDTVSRDSLSSKERDDIFWLARIIHAEAQGEPYIGKVAAGSVVMNRVESSQFPNTIYNVIFEYYHNIPQFSPVQDGTIYNNPNAESLKAAQEAYMGAKPVGGALYFFNPSKAAGSWIVNNRQYITTIGAHAFYR